MDELTEYERARAANIAANQALLAGLDIKTAQDEMAASSSKPQPTKAKPIQSRKRKAEPPPVDAPRRQSRRLRSGATPINPNETKAQRAKREAEEARLEREAEEEAERALEAERLAKMPRHQDLELEVLAQEFEEMEMENWKTLQDTLSSKDYPRRISGPDSETQDTKMEHAREELVEELQKLVVTRRAKVCKERIYSVAYHPIITKDVVLFGDKNGSLGIWDARAVPDEHEEETRDDGEGGQYWRLQPHWPQTSKSSISAIKISPRDGHTVFTSSYDGTLRSTSFVTEISTELVATRGHLLSSFDLSQDGKELWVSDSSGRLLHVDVREHSTTRRWQLTEKEKIGCVSVNPVVPHLLLTASNNRTLRMWDSRYLKKVDISTAAGGSDNESEDEDDRAPASTWEEVQNYLETKHGPRCLWGEWQHRQSVSSAFWDMSGRRIVSTSYDDTLRIWDIRPNALKADGPLKSFRPAHEIKHNCQTGRWVTILKARWSENPDAYPHFTIGNMAQSLDVVGCDGQVLAKLTDRAKISAVQAVTASHPSILARAVSGNASGRCVFWSPADV
ncbi:DNA damage-binding protein CMR1 [Ceratobasidium sp. AG-Ba]|nr:DNA damage-binding protein CMR1 [Ceratobasidium sp. AG-Ba]